jgi:hypothetical protein
MGFLGTRSTLIPFQMVRVNDRRQVIEVAAEKETVKNGPTFDDDSEIFQSSRMKSTLTTACSSPPQSRSVPPTATETTTLSRPPRRGVSLIAPT